MTALSYETTASAPPARADRSRRGWATIMAAVLLADACLHLYWSTGATWPASSAYTLSIAVLGFGVPFQPHVLLPLAAVLLLATGLILAHAVLGRHGLGRLWHLGTAGVTAAAALRGLLGIIWTIPATGHLPGGFYWLNLLVYTPLCWVLVAAGCHVLEPRRAGRRRHLPTVRATAVTVPVVLVALLLSGAYGYSPRVARAYSPSQGLGTVSSRYVDTRLARFHYIRAGRGSPVVLLAPGAVALSAWLPEFRALAADHTVYAVDLPGQGFTRLHDDGFAFNLRGMTKAIGAFLNAVHVERTALAGNSWSGGWALGYAQLHPVRVSRLLLLAPSGLNRPDPAGWEVLKLPVIGRIIAELGAASPSATADQVRAYFVHPARATPGLIESVYATNTFPDNLRAMYQLEAGLDWSVTERALPSTMQPTLVLWGRQDTVLPVGDAAMFGARLPRVSVHILNGCGHALTVDCPRRVTARMAGFLRGH